MNLRVDHASQGEQPVLRRLMELYLHDFSEFDGRDIGADGAYGYRYLDNYWQEDGRWPFLFRVDGRLAGFALVRRLPRHFEMAEFFVLRKYRRRGMGGEAARAVICQFPGRWHIHMLAANTPARAFWPRIATELVGPGAVRTGSDAAGVWLEFRLAAAAFESP